MLSTPTRSASVQGAIWWTFLIEALLDEVEGREGLMLPSNVSCTPRVRQDALLIREPTSYTGATPL